MGALDKFRGVLLGRPGGRIEPSKFCEYEDALCRTIREEYGFTALPIVTNMDFGHTDPMFVIPLGLPIRIDSTRREIAINEAAVTSDSGQASRSSSPA